MEAGSTSTGILMPPERGSTDSMMPSGPGVPSGACSTGRAGGGRWVTMYRFSDSDVVRSPARSQGRPEESLDILGNFLGGIGAEFSGDTPASLFSLCLSSRLLEYGLTIEELSALKLGYFMYIKNILPEKKNLQVCHQGPMLECGLVCYWRKNRRREKLLGCGPTGRTPGCYPGRCWFEPSRPSHSPPLQNCRKVLNDAC